MLSLFQNLLSISFIFQYLVSIVNDVVIGVGQDDAQLVGFCLEFCQSADVALAVVRAL